MKHQPKNKTEIRGIIFDWGGIFSYSGNPLGRPEIIKRLKRDKSSISIALADAIDAFSRGKITSRKYWHTYAQILNIPKYSPQRLRKIYLEYTPKYNMLDILKLLSLKYPIALLSNLNTDMKTVIIKDLGIDKYFKHMIFSNDVGLLKPEPKIYKLTLQRLGLPASKTLFIDDEKNNVDMAKKLGIKTHLFISEKKCRLRLKRLKLL